MAKYKADPQALVKSEPAVRRQPKVRRLAASPNPRIGAHVLLAQCAEEADALRRGHRRGVRRRARLARLGHLRLNLQAVEDGWPLWLACN